MTTRLCGCTWPHADNPVRAYPPLPERAGAQLHHPTHRCSKPRAHGEFHVCACGVALRAAVHQ